VGEIDDADLRAVLAIASRSCGVDFSLYKTPTMRRRVEHRMGAVRTSAEAYLNLLERDPGEQVALVDALLVKTTSMFRDPRTFDVLRRVALPALFARRAKEGATTVRGWVIGSSTGEEAFSLAMCFREAGEPFSAIHPMLLATDVDRTALERVARGAISAQSKTDVPKELAERFLEPAAAGFRLVKELRSMIKNEQHDILTLDRPAPRSAIIASFDLVSCRNVLIYLTRSARERVLSRMVKSCAPGGLLVLGEAEAPAEDLEGMKKVHEGAPVYVVG